MELVRSGLIGQRFDQAFISEPEGIFPENPFPHYLRMEAGRITERIRRPTYGKLEIDITIEDPKAYTKPFTVRVNQQISPDDEIIEFVCNENQQFRKLIKID